MSRSAISTAKCKKRKKENEEKIKKRTKYMRLYRAEKAAQRETEDGTTYEFANRMAKSRSIQKMKAALPESPEDRAAVLLAYTDHKRIPKSPAIQRFYASSNDTAEQACMKDIKSALDTLKLKRDDDSRTAVNVITSAISGESVRKARCAKDLSQTLGIKRKAMSSGKRIRTTILKSTKSAFQYTKRKTRCDSITDDVKQRVFDFWLQADISRATNNKNDIKRVRLGKNLYSSHTCQILEKTQSEVFQDFKDKYPDVKIGQRRFEMCKPYYVRSANTKDKSTCCCRHHVETRALFKSCMAFRKSVDRNITENVTVYQTLTDLVSDTLCEPSANTRQHKACCLDRTCPECGVNKFVLLQDEQISDPDVMKVSWERYEYQPVKQRDGSDLRKLMLVKKNTAPNEMFEYFMQLLTTFPSHEFRAKWQAKQLKNLVTNLPIGHCVIIHDYSENYRCIAKKEIQASYFQKAEITLHISVLHRHAVLEIDGVDSTDENPNIVTEQFVVISPDLKHDHHFTHTVQQQVVEYLHSVSDRVHTIHEFTDGCSCQYKSCHCLGDVSHACRDFGLSRFDRNFFETSHGRGPHDAAGGYIKKTADLAVIRETHVIQNAEQLFEFATENLQNTKEHAVSSRRIFKYVPSIDRDREDRYFSPVKENRKIHQVINTSDTEGMLDVRHLSCYTCSECLDGQHQLCNNGELLGQFSTIRMTKLHPADEDDNCDNSLLEDPKIYSLITPGTVFAVKADDENYPYFIVRASSASTKLRKSLTDKWGSSYAAGNEVIHGYYYSAQGHDIMKLALVKRLKATVPSQSVLYICNEIDMENDTIQLSDSLHRRILKCI